MPERKQKGKWIVIVFTVVLIAVAGVVCFLVWDAYFKKKDVESDEPKVVTVTTVETEEKTEEKKEDVAVEAEGEKKEEVPQYDGEDPNKSEVLTGAITYSKIFSGRYVIRINIDQYISKGSCTVGLRREGMSIYSEKVAIIDGASTSTCEGFDIPLEGLGNGKTQLTIYMEGDGKTGEINGEIEL